MYVNIEHYYKETKGITLNTVIAAITNIILNYMFIPKFGYVAAAFTTFVSYFISFILHALKAKRLENNLYPINYFILPILEIGIFTFLFYLFMDNMMVRWLIILFYVLFMFIKEWNRIIMYFPKLDFRKGS